MIGLEPYSPSSFKAFYSEESAKKDISQQFPHLARR